MLPGGRDYDAVSENASQLGCLPARVPGADDQDALRTMVSEAAAEVESLSRRDPACEAADRRQRVLCGQDVLLGQEFHGLYAEIPALGRTRDRIVMERMRKPDDRAPSGKAGKHAVQVGGRFDPGEDASVLEQLGPGRRDGRACLDVRRVIVACA